jgi:putative membrane protein
MLIAACVLAALAALVHVYIFVLESVRWEEPATRRVFGTTSETAAVTQPLAYNQGFYNLFLAIVTVTGVALVGSHREAAVALLVAGTGSMLAAALVLITSDRAKARAAVVQGLFPALTMLCLLGWATFR